ncbi:hypothetical protein KIW84_012600 [Lathyrus oleraceus]|uniref:Uncharacterized protein n=1 Tax=Pisum sativum TaxID=3888 RepID=A0A9D5BI01_PEA|nr:hypothetical protein KIW84_012600 [Pisum sativum]
MAKCLAGLALEHGSLDMAQLAYDSDAEFVELMFTTSRQGNTQAFKEPLLVDHKYAGIIERVGSKVKILVFGDHVADAPKEKPFTSSCTLC